MEEVELISGVYVSRETFERLEAFRDLVLKWTARINLVSTKSAATLWDRHILDSAQLIQHAPDSFNRWVDLGSGGGFPGIVVATLNLDLAPDAEMILVESDQRKATFLRAAIRELGLNAQVQASRAETLAPMQADVLTARALASLSELLPLASRHLKPDGIAIFPKGRSALDEIRDAQQGWTFQLEQSPSKTDAEAAILKLERIERV
ncbi:16S rRNA (guanine(527)-N(7))-methyltransferase RsmG [Pelagovum pacificum]|uniref:Ribosomal RNA small subunit methyltransferase G n=1 Tax=Pelagovum pacificum TaxID=2588711 RepID=A0A5C5GH40_9RHOB|nr:16S rRNA (guanine(527)-N(7))-methyltransferase RsmG [Pelagovum pacificum]QQA42780.1 16S rRNA (guanine(527)-N(7))-methyltransferase RsmG [Pelagovum pacificum]TNY34072.1 16S rRNA (guanine(527)-N(7))-methyltransferase RsmG [Pelagovum pacificum]